MKNWKGINRKKKKKAVLWCQLVAYNAHRTASLHAARVKPQDTVSLLVIHSCSAQDNTSSFLALLHGQAIHVFLSTNGFSQSSLSVPVVFHADIHPQFQNSCCHAFPFPHPCYSSQHLIYAPSLFPKASHEGHTGHTVSAAAVWAAGASTFNNLFYIFKICLTNTCCSCRENSALSCSTLRKLSKDMEKCWCPLRSFCWWDVNVQRLSVDGPLWMTEGKWIWKCKKARAN